MIADLSPDNKIILVLKNKTKEIKRFIFKI